MVDHQKKDKGFTVCSWLEKKDQHLKTAYPPRSFVASPCCPDARQNTIVCTTSYFRYILFSLSQQQLRQQRQLEEFFSKVDVLKSTECAASVLDAADSAFEGIFLGGGNDDQTVPWERRGFGGDGAASGMGGGEEDDAAAAVRKSVYHLRQVKQV